MMKALGLGLLACVGIGCGDIPIASPQGLAVALQADGAHLSWDPVSPAATELLIERSAPGERFKKIASVPVNSVEFLDTTPAPAGAIYTYRLLAFADGLPWTGTYSGEASAAH